MDVADVLEDDGRVKPIKEWPLIWRQYVSGIEVSEIFEGSGSERVMVGVLRKIKWPDKLKNLEMLGRHINIQAFKDTTELSGKMPVYLSKEDMLL